MSHVVRDTVALPPLDLESKDTKACSMESVLLSVIVSAFNEEATIDELLTRVLAADPLEKEILVIDDGSTDATAQRVEARLHDSRIKLISHSVNQGKGAAIRTGLAAAKGQLTIMKDADLEYDPEDYSKILFPIIEEDADIVYGSRHLERQHRLRFFDVGILGLNLAARVLFGVRTTDEATCYKAAPTAVFRRMNLICNRFEFCPEVTAKVGRLRLRLVEVPVSYRPRTETAGKKLRWYDGVSAFWTLLKWRFKALNSE